jgi:hypothetical protein
MVPLGRLRSTRVEVNESKNTLACYVTESIKFEKSFKVQALHVNT